MQNKIQIYKGDISDPQRKIKINLPYSRETYKTANGEGVWCYIISPEDMETYLDDTKAGRLINGVLLNDSLYFPELKHKSLVPVELRGAKRPVVPLEFLKDILLEERAELIQSEIKDRFI